MGSAVVSAEPNLTIGSYTLVSSKRVSRVEFEYTYQAEANNTGSSAVDVSAVLTSAGNGTTIIEGNLTFGDVAIESNTISNDTFTVRQNRLFKFDRAALVWEIAYFSGQESIVVVFDGGIFEFSNGLILSFPEGAVTEDTEITVGYISCDLVDPILMAETLMRFSKRCLAGFLTEPSGLVFHTPITASLPVKPLDIGEYLIHLNVDFNNQSYEYVPSEINYDIIENLVEIKINHFTSHVVSAMADQEDRTQYAELDINDPNFCQVLETKINYQNLSFETTAGEGCLVDYLNLVTEFPLCPNIQPFHDNVPSFSKTCPDDLEVKLVPNIPATFPICTELKLEAIITMITGENEIIFGPLKIVPFWDLIDPDNIADSFDVNEGSIVGGKEGLVTVRVQHDDGTRTDLIDSDIVFTCDIVPIIVTPESKVIDPGEIVELEAEVFDCTCDDLPGEGITWESSDSDIAYIVEGNSGSSISVRGNKPGTATITASYQGGFMLESAITIIEVTDGMNGLWQTEAVSYEQALITCRALDGQPQECYGNPTSRFSAYIWQFSQIGNDLSVSLVDPRIEAPRYPVSNSHLQPWFKGVINNGFFELDGRALVITSPRVYSRFDLLGGLSPNKLNFTATMTHDFTSYYSSELFQIIEVSWPIFGTKIVD